MVLLVGWGRWAGSGDKRRPPVGPIDAVPLSPEEQARPERTAAAMGTEKPDSPTISKRDVCVCVSVANVAKNF